MKRMKIALTVAGCVAMLTGCTKLDESLNGSVSETEFYASQDIPSLLKGCYVAFRTPYQDQTGIWCLQDMASDDGIGPTRGGDWDDNGVWRVLHQQTWLPDNTRIQDNFSNLLQIVFRTTDIQKFDINANTKAQALFLRAYATFSTLDLYGKVPFRQVGTDPLLDPDILDADAATAQIMTDLNAAMPDLAATGPFYTANRWAAKALLAKLYLNKGTFKDRANPTFDAADMQQVITLCDEIIASGLFNLEADYFKAFTPTNTENSKEILFSLQNTNEEAGNVRFHWHAGTHYNQNPSGWNGFATLASFYDKFEATDQRRGVDYGAFTTNTGMRVGMLIGQQYGRNGTVLKDRAGNNLIFTREVDNIVTGNVETPGIRVVKYVPDMKPDWSADFDNANNDYVMLRYADVLLMKAEALMRSGGAGALEIVNEIRAIRGATPLASLTADNLLDERGRELYWESWRRNDLIRFGKYLAPFGPTKPGTSDPKYLLFPIPANALAANPALGQNPGY